MLTRDQKAIDKLPQDVRFQLSGSGNLLLHAGRGWELEPLAEGYMPQCVEFFAGNNDSSSLRVWNAQLKHLDPDFFSAEGTFAICIDHKPRYIEFKGKVILNTLGGCILPDILLSPVAQANFFKRVIEA